MRGSALKVECSGGAALSAGTVILSRHFPIRWHTKAFGSRMIRTIRYHPV